MTANFTGGAEAAGLCTSATASLRAPCFEAVGTIMARFHTTAEARERACREIAVTGEDLTACRRGGADGMPQLVEG